MNRTTVLLDMDGVIVDFVRGSLAFHGKTLPYADVRWDFPQQVGFGATWAPAFWGPLGHDFWSDLPWTPFGRELLAGLESRVGDDILFTSSPCDTPGCESGKRAWLAKHVPHLKDHFNFSKKKHKLSKPFTVLVDDHDANVEKFNKGLGIAVLVPLPWSNDPAGLNAAGDGPDMDRVWTMIDWALKVSNEGRR